MGKMFGTRAEAIGTYGTTRAERAALALADAEATLSPEEWERTELEETHAERLADLIRETRWEADDYRASLV